MPDEERERQIEKVALKLTELYEDIKDWHSKYVEMDAISKQTLDILEALRRRQTTSDAHISELGLTLETVHVYVRSIDHSIRAMAAHTKCPLQPSPEPMGPQDKK